ncbi:hypothetical protein V8E53_007778 [Lactarius tabidus]
MAEISLTQITKISGDEPSTPIRGHQKFLISDWPFPGGKTLYWHKFFVPLLIAWAGSQLDPFSTNNGVGSEAMLIWGRMFPAIKLTSKDHEILMGVAENALNNWHSNIGKAGHGAIVDIWNDNTNLFSTLEDCVDFVADSLDNMSFVYEHPNMLVNIYFMVTNHCNQDIMSSDPWVLELCVGVSRDYGAGPKLW